MEISIVVIQAKGIIVEVVPCVKEQNAKAFIEVWVKDTFNIEFIPTRDEKLKTYATRFLELKSKRKGAIHDFEIFTFKCKVEDV